MTGTRDPDPMAAQHTSHVRFRVIGAEPSTPTYRAELEVANSDLRIPDGP